LGFCLGHDVIPRTPTLKAIRKQPQRQGKEKHTPQSFSLHPFNNETELSYVLGPTNPCPTAVHIQPHRNLADFHQEEVLEVEPANQMDEGMPEEQEKVPVEEVVVLVEVGPQVQEKVPP